MGFLRNFWRFFSWKFFFDFFGRLFGNSSRNSRKVLLKFSPGISLMIPSCIPPGKTLPWIYSDLLTGFFSFLQKFLKHVLLGMTCRVLPEVFHIIFFFQRSKKVFIRVYCIPGFLQELIKRQFQKLLREFSTRNSSKKNQRINFWRNSWNFVFKEIPKTILQGFLGSFYGDSLVNFSVSFESFLKVIFKRKIG